MTTPNIIVEHNGVQEFTADTFNLNGNVWNFTDATPPPPPPGRMTSALVSWITHAAFTQNTDLTQYKNVAGVNTHGQVPIDWPYVSGAAYKWSMRGNQYAALAIVVPPAGNPVSTHNIKSMNEVAGAAPFIASLSTTPGDFSPATALKVVTVLPDDQPALWFHNAPTQGVYVGLNPGSVYYLNVQPQDESVSTKLIVIQSQ